jgi:hypothetical protein
VDRSTGQVSLPRISLSVLPRHLALQEYPATLLIVGQYVLVRYTAIIVLLLLALVMGLAVL